MGCAGNLQITGKVAFPGRVSYTHGICNLSQVYIKIITFCALDNLCVQHAHQSITQHVGKQMLFMLVAVCVFSCIYAVHRLFSFLCCKSIHILPVLAPFSQGCFALVHQGGSKRGSSGQSSLVNNILGSPCNQVSRANIPTPDLTFTCGINVTGESTRQGMGVGACCCM